MSGLASRRLLASSPLKACSEASSICRPVQCLSVRSFSKTPQRLADEPPKTTPASSSSIPSSPGTSASMLGLADLFQKNQTERANRPSPSAYLDPSRISSIGSLSYSPSNEQRVEEPHHLHVFATRHNTHITLTAPNRNSLISVSAGNIGFKKSGRKHYDSAFQLAGYVMGRIQEQGLLPKIKQLEICLRGFGAGREAVTKALLGTEGKILRGKVVKVSDATRLKFGGTRSPKPRRLG